MISQIQCVVHPQVSYLSFDAFLTPTHVSTRNLSE